MNTIRRLCTPLLILAFVLHVVLALAHHGGQAPLLPSTTYSIRTSSAAFTVPSVAVIPKTFQANEDVPPNIIEILAVEAAPQLPTTPTGQISRNGERVPENPEIPHNETPSPSTDLVDISDFSETVSISQEPMAVKKRAFLAVVSTLLGYITLNELYHHANLGVAGAEEGREEARWIATSHSWLDRKACQWFGICGAGHLRSQVWFGGHTQRKAQEPLQHDEEWLSAWTKGKSRPEDWSDDERVLREIPKYVFDYAPLVHLYSGEQFWPCDIAEHLIHTTPHLNYTPLQARSEHPNLTNLDELNQWKQGRFVYLTSDDNVEERPDWLGGEKNIPKSPPDSGVEDEDEVAWAEWDGRIDGPSPEETDDARKDWSEVGEGSFREQGGERPNPTVGSVPAPPETVGYEQLPDEIRSRVIEQKSQKRIRGGRSDAPAVLVVVDKGHGVVDAFWFYFYSFNLGNVVLNVRFGNHVGDWEHSLVRFHHGKPRAVFISEHSFGEAYTYEAVEKIGKRPVIYSATGTHAMYATPGRHPYVLPLGLLHDETDRGPLWDPLLNSHTYTYDYLNDTLRSSTITPHAPTEWFYFAGRWGDKYYPLSDRRQYRFAGQYHYVGGPLGPRFKNLGRKKVCQGGPDEDCLIKNRLGGKRRARRWEGVGEGEEMSEEATKRFLRPEDILGEE